MLSQAPGPQSSLGFSLCCVLISHSTPHSLRASRKWATFKRDPTNVAAFQSWVRAVYAETQPIKCKRSWVRLFCRCHEKPHWG